MDRALWFLLELRFWAWLRHQRQKIRTLKGALLAGFGAILLCLWILSLVAGPSARRLEPGSMERYGSLVLLAYSLVVLFISSGGKAISFTLAEVNFLFSGPFSRRGLLAYKIVASLSVSSLSAGFMMFFYMRTHVGSWQVLWDYCCRRCSCTCCRWRFPSPPLHWKHTLTIVTGGTR